MNVKGELVGINTAIASNTGSYTGYSFAVPVAIVKKVIDDIKEHGTVQRAILGISMVELTQELASLAKMEGNFSGVYVADLNRSGAAYKAGVREGDILVAIDSKKMKNPSEVQASINTHKPGDVVELLVFRDGKEIKMNATLQGESNVASTDSENPVVLGAVLGEPDAALLKKLRIRGGVEIVELGNGKFKQSGISQGFIITHINQNPVTSVKEVVEIVNNSKRAILVEGMYKNGDVYYYGVGV